jgi:hypothetical protein
MFRRRDRKSTPPSGDFDPTKVDLVAVAASGTVNLYIIQDQPWTERESEWRSLNEKIHNYVAFALDGQMGVAYPDTPNRPWRIVIDTYVGPPPTQTIQALSEVGDAVRVQGGDLVMHSLRPPTGPGRPAADQGAWRLGTGHEDGVPVDL